jgi:hypothetical protein
MIIIRRKQKQEAVFMIYSLRTFFLVEHLAVLLLKNSLKIIYAEISVAFTSLTDT